MQRADSYYYRNKQNYSKKSSSFPQDFYNNCIPVISKATLRVRNKPQNITRNRFVNYYDSCSMIHLGLRKTQYLEIGELRATLNSMPKFQIVRNVPESQITNTFSHIN